MLPETFSQWELWTPVTWDFPALFKSGGHLVMYVLLLSSAVSIDVCTIALLCCFFVFCFPCNVSTLQVDSPLLSICIVYLYTTSDLFC